MISDEDQISDSDSEESSPPPPQAEKRQYHNLLERNRRNVLKYSFWKLRCAIPSLQKKKLVMNAKKASRAKILRRAIDYINRAERRKPSLRQDIANLERDNAYLEQQYKAIQEAEEAGDTSKLQAIFRKVEEVGNKVYEEDISDPEDDDEDSDDGTNGQDNEAVGPGDPRMEWSSDNDLENNEQEQDWTVDVSEESESSESEESSEESSSDNE